MDAALSHEIDGRHEHESPTGDVTIWEQSELATLEKTHELTLPAIQRAWQESDATKQLLGEALLDGLPEEVSFVAFGSLARREITPGSDLDWCLLIDGRADAGHRKLQGEVNRRIEKTGVKAPSPTGAFGAMVFSHELIHCIGGGGDTNPNLTRRLLLLLESVELTPFSPVSAHRRILRGILERYFEEEIYFPGKPFFPRFFLNDVVRFWRTMAVDYAAKNSERDSRGWALRNAKLRFSRKLLFVAGLLLAYSPRLFPEAESITIGKVQQPLLFPETLSTTECCLRELQRPPLELLARVCNHLGASSEIVRGIFESYDQFLTILGETASREKLNGLTLEKATDDELFQSVRKLGAVFQRGLDGLFLHGEGELAVLTRKYGIF